MKISSFFKPFIRPFTKSSANSASRASKASADTDRVSIDPRLTGHSAASHAAVSALHAGLANPEYRAFTAQAAAQAASKPSKAAKVAAQAEHKVAGTQPFVRQAGTASTSSTAAALSAAIAAHSRPDAFTMLSAERAAQPLSFMGKVKAFFYYDRVR